MTGRAQILLQARVSNDRPFTESLFRTAKYRADYPSQLVASAEDPCHWVASFVDSYNHRHRHSNIKLVKPYQRYSGKAVELLWHWSVVYDRARQQNLGR